MWRFKISANLEEQKAIEAPYKEGDYIGTKYKVHGVLGAGGFGVVYLVYEHNQKAVLALKTFHEESLKGDDARNLFRKEAQTWVNLERHHYLVRAYWVEKISNRLYIAMEFIAPDEQKRNTLQHYLGDDQSFDLARSLKWAIQFCHGMEYACLKGIKCHRDIKPDNIMISDNTVKISDFGLAAVVGEVAKQSKGVMEYLAPEVLQGKEAGVQSDIYSFGIVLWQMATGSASPPARGWLGRIPSVDGPMQAIIKSCLQNKPKDRYQKFEELRKALEPLLKKETGEVIKPPDKTELEEWELVNKGKGLCHLGQFDEAISSLNKAIKINPRYDKAYYNRAVAYYYKKEYNKAWEDVHKAQGLGLQVNPRLIELLRQALGRQR